MPQKLVTTIATLILTSAISAQNNNIVDEVIWMVGDEPILLSDVEEMRISAEMYGERIENPYCVIPEQLAIQKLFLHQAALDSIEVDESLIIKAADEQVNRAIQNFGSRENVETMARKTIAQFREQQKTMFRNDEKIRQVRKKITDNLKITPAEVREYFNNLPQDSLPLIPTQVEVQIITSAPQVTRKEVERIEERLREFARQVNSGETEFSMLAKFYSQDGSARNGGELGYSGRNQWVPEFSNVAFSLNDPKKVSKIVRTEYGFHIIQFIDKRGDKVNVRHILLKPEIEENEITKSLEKLDSIANDIRLNKLTFEKAAVQSDDKNTRNNKGLMAYLNPETHTNMSRFQMEQLPPDVARVVETMQPGEVSKAFKMTNEKGQTVCAIIKLKNKIESHRAHMTEDFQVLKDIVYQKRSEEKIKQWIIDKQKQTFVRINPNWRNCDFMYPNWIK
ncbi:chaperone SurA [Bacteroidaceae bacterium]|uniref:peptidylprolyl isomerase n=1 Tax=Prevotella sp. MGM2 TaxID=2033406 RepID=UPI000CEA07E1|nr:peptidylprolyl isomerase [Prevotella sp. MGM2]GAY31180.1 peptidyl-prolyl cis-trans isomerase PPIC-type [Prevotella sp. MGM2]GFI34457.1 chaperone SurA [Bacteroidaceae bacterium]